MTSSSFPSFHQRPWITTTKVSVVLCLSLSFSDSLRLTQPIGCLETGWLGFLGGRCYERSRSVDFQAPKMARWQLEDAVRIGGFYAHFPTSNICIQVTNIRWLIHCHFKFIHYGCVCKNWGPRSSNTLRKIDISQGVVGILIGDRQAALVFRPLIFWGNIFLKILKEWLAADGNDWG